MPENSRWSAQSHHRNRGRITSKFESARMSSARRCPPVALPSPQRDRRVCLSSTPHIATVPHSLTVSARARARACGVGVGVVSFDFSFVGAIHLSSSPRGVCSHQSGTARAVRCRSSLSATAVFTTENTENTENTEFTEFTDGTKHKTSRDSAVCKRDSAVKSAVRVREAGV